MSLPMPLWLRLRRAASWRLCALAFRSLEDRFAQWNAPHLARKSRRLQERQFTLPTECDKTARPV